jgi:F-type H+-transporting ATPase subunit delta
MELTVVAKPYAKALSEVALADGSYNDWQQLLAALSAIVADDATGYFISAPSTTSANKTAFFQQSLTSVLARDLTAKEQNFIDMLIKNNKVLAASGIAQLFNNLVTTGSKNIKVLSAYELDTNEKENLIQSLNTKYGCEVNLDVEVDNNLSAGVVIKDGDKVIDLSISARTAVLAARLSM